MVWITKLNKASYTNKMEDQAAFSMMTKLIFPFVTHNELKEHFQQPEQTILIPLDLKTGPEGFYQFWAGFQNLVFFRVTTRFSIREVLKRTLAVQPQSQDFLDTTPREVFFKKNGENLLPTYTQSINLVLEAVPLGINEGLDEILRDLSAVEKLRLEKKVPDNQDTMKYLETIPKANAIVTKQLKAIITSAKSMAAQEKKEKKRTLPPTNSTLTVDQIRQLKLELQDLRISDQGIQDVLLAVLQLKPVVQGIGLTRLRGKIAQYLITEVLNPDSDEDQGVEELLNEF
jgi:hypothetical protein